MEEQKPIKAKKAMPRKPEAAEKSSLPEQKKNKSMLALILIRGLTNTKIEIRATLDTLRLKKKHACVVFPDTPSNRASAEKCKDYIAFGEIDDETYKQLVDKRGIKQANGELKKFFCMHPPRGGFERKGIKQPFTRGGALGYRGSKINDLIKKML